MKKTNINAIWADHLIEELVRQGVDTFCVSSGARCGPLTEALARRKDISLNIHFDERASAFYALGYGRGAGKPAVWVTTSGSAVAQGWPAVVEASQDHVPLICLTADRPPELRDAGANQTINQVNVFGGYARWFCDMPAPDTNVPLSYVLTTVAEALGRATGTYPGPVHLNAMFREPLSRASDGKDYREYLQPLQAWRAGKEPYVRQIHGTSACDGAGMREIVRLLKQARRGVIMVGRIADERERVAAHAIVSLLNWPVLPDVASGLRIGARDGNVIGYADQILLSDEKARALAPDVLLHLGGPLVSKRLLAFSGTAERYVQVSATGHRNNPAHRSLQVVTCALASILPELMLVRRWPASQTLKLWVENNRRVKAALRHACKTEMGCEEWLVASDLSRLIDPDHALFVGSSMPVRDLDMYGDPAGPRVAIGANRGASGIDGTIASAFGFAQALKRPVTLLLGDLAFLHDLNALYYARSATYPVTLVVINNDGGGIFSFLSFAGSAEHFEQVFGTPHGLTFRAAAEQFGWAYEKPARAVAWRTAYTRMAQSGRSGILEITSDRQANVAAHRALQAKMVSALEGP